MSTSGRRRPWAPRIREMVGAQDPTGITRAG